MKRAFYSASIPDFLAASPEEILGLIVANDHSSNLEHTQRRAWMEEIQIMQDVLSPYHGRFISNMRFREWDSYLKHLGFDAI